ncbi:MAG: ABC transporter ATP-binding protein [Actinomycetaceae bacterium]|nr:ABC transporter ATP-binding protein [Actinomycetaceae bacterium]
MSYYSPAQGTGSTGGDGQQTTDQPVDPVPCTEKVTTDRDRPAVIEIRDFTFQYKAQAEPTLHDINLTIYQGEKIAIVGQSGSGKSTLAHVINGLIPHRYPGTHSGSVMVAGLNPLTEPLDVTSKKVGTVLQDPDGQFIGLTVAEDIAFALENDEVPHPELEERVQEAAKIVDITHRLESAPQDLSGGQKQRVSMAGVLVDNVDILLFDEPLASLDPATGQQAIETIDHIHQGTQSNNLDNPTRGIPNSQFEPTSKANSESRPTTVVIIEHRLEDVLHRPLDRIIVMDAGRIIADASPNEIIASRILTDHGIREPLYVTALRLAGHHTTADEKPANVNSIEIPDSAREILRQWAREPRRIPREDNPIVELRDIWFGINDVPIINGISTHINRGEIIALCGSNGAGKSTLAKLICGFEIPDSGTIHLNGTDITQAPIARRGQDIGFVIQNPNQMISKPMIREEVELALNAAGVAPDDRERRLEESLRICGLWAYRDWPISALSYGQRKRVTIASVMVSAPDVIILDEPTAGQDWAHYTEIMEFLRGLNDAGTTIILITHDMHLALEYTDRALVMANGQIIAEQSSASVLATPHITETASLRTTSLYDLALRIGAADPTAFIEQFITRENAWREHILADHLGTGR